MAHYSHRLILAIKRAEQATQQAKERTLRDYGLTGAQHVALAILSDQDGLSSAELARRCLVTPQTMNSTVSRLEARGLISRTPHPVHRNVTELSLTPHGAELFGRADVVAEELDRTLAAVLDEDELSELRDMLGRIVTTAEELGTGP